jgi:hypothetical protein
MNKHRFTLVFDSTIGEWYQEPTTNNFESDISLAIHVKANEVISNAVNLLNTMYANAGKDN